MCRGTRGLREHTSLRRKRGPGRDGQLGQSLVEFALLLPILLLLTLIAIDFGRVYLGWINLQNMARIGADFAANNADANWADPDFLATYTNVIGSDASATNCPLAPGQPAPPTFTDIDGGGIGIGDRASVSLVCRFHVITPLISFVVGSDLNVTASSVFPIKQGLVATSSGGGGGGGGGCLLPSPAINATPSTNGNAPLTVTFRDASGGGAGVSWIWSFGDPSIPDSTARDPGPIMFNTAGSYDVTLTVTNSCGTATTPSPTTITVGPANPPALCTVPTFVGNNTHKNQAQGIWTAAGFTTTVQYGAGNGNFVINFQNPVGGSKAPCATATITVAHN